MCANSGAVPCGNSQRRAPTGYRNCSTSPDPLPVVGHHQRERGLVHHAVDAEAAVRAADVILAEDHPPVPIDLAGGDALDETHAASIAAVAAGSLAGVLLTSLNPAAVAAGADLSDAVRLGSENGFAR